MRAEIEREIQKAGRRLATNYAAKGPSKKVRSMIRGGGASFFYIFIISQGKLQADSSASTGSVVILSFVILLFVIQSSLRLPF